MDTIEVIFLDDDRITVLDRVFVSKGSKVRYKGKTPAKEPENGVTYTFEGWTNEEKLESVTEKLVCVAKYSASTPTATKEENAMLKASLENAEKQNLNDTIEAGQKVSEQQKALAKDPRTAEQIVNEVVENGKCEIGQEQNKDNMDR